MSGIGKFVVGVLIGTFYVFVAWKLWWWFAIPLGAPNLNFLQAFGLYALAASVMLWSLNADISEKSQDKTMLLAFGKAIVAAILLGEGYLAHVLISILGK